MNNATEPQLAPPGAGLPRAELWIARGLFALRCWRGSRARFDAHFQRERAAIRHLVGPLDPAAAARRVLIPRLRGLEDSSRHWSVWMTLDHLRIVNRGIAGTIGKLARGVVPEGAASTAKVKPSPAVTADVVVAHERACDELLAAVAGVPDLKTKVRYAHPWFGPLDIFGWHAMAAGHMSIHRAQLERIIGGLGPPTRGAA